MRNPLMLSLTVLTLSSSAFAQDKTGWPKALTFGIIPTEGSSATLTKWQPFFAYLGKTLGVEIKPQVGADYTAVILAMQNKQLDVAYFGPKSYITAVEQAGAEAIVMDNTVKGGLGYHSIIISKAGSGPQSLSSARGKTFAFVDPQSTSGYLIPLTHFVYGLKVKPDTYFSKVIFAGSHENAILAVLNGTVDVAATNDADMANAVAKGAVKASDFNVLYVSASIPNGPTAVRGDLPASLKTAIKSAMLGYKDPKGLDALNLKSWVSASDKDYDPIRQANDVQKIAK
ncbi:phosphonate ABC transporter substrate-binding protein [Deinococcus sp.]|uniref:phosphonate ABC transporter substrate-binding protein n=1 Tax=Deinococcus sp. TaxID=47478 RepID=UPI0025FF0552|nr:phosphonate ABC transporter substrate-binding protein [Deinococcus sp.]